MTFNFLKVLQERLNQAQTLAKEKENERKKSELGELKEKKGLLDKLCLEAEVKAKPHQNMD